MNKKSAPNSLMNKKIRSKVYNQLCEVKGIGQTKSTFVMDAIKQTHSIL